MKHISNSSNTPQTPIQCNTTNTVAQNFPLNTITRAFPLRVQLALLRYNSYFWLNIARRLSNGVHGGRLVVVIDHVNLGLTCRVLVVIEARGHHAVTCLPQRRVSREQVVVQETGDNAASDGSDPVDLGKRQSVIEKQS